MQRASTPSSVPGTPRGRATPTRLRGAWLPPVAAACASTLALCAAAHEDNHTHEHLSRGALQLLEAPSDFYTPGRYLDVVVGSVEEDDNPNWKDHFYNPKTGDGTTVAVPSASGARARAQLLWNQAVAHYRAGRDQEAFRTLGAVLHLVQDMTSPAHTHQDVHAQGFSGCDSDGDDFEKWGWCNSSLVLTDKHIFEYVTNDGVHLSTDRITERLQRSLDALFAGRSQFAPSSGLPSFGIYDTRNTGGNFVQHVANLTYDFTSFEVVLVDVEFGPDDQPSSEFGRMFPTLRESQNIFGGFYVDQGPDQWVGWASGDCGGRLLGGEEWWLTETGCSQVAGVIRGRAYIENTGGEDTANDSYLLDLLVPRFYAKPMFTQLYGTSQNAGVPSGFTDGNRSKTMLRIQGDVLYAVAVAYGAGLLQAFEDTVSPAPVADIGGDDVGGGRRYSGGGTGCVEVTFDASASYDPNGSIVLYEWDFDGDGVQDAATTEPVIRHAYERTFLGEAFLVVTDDDGRSSMASAVVEVLPCPVADAGGPYRVRSHDFRVRSSDVGVTFDASDSFHPDGEIVAYEWDFDGDGTIDASLTSPVVVHRYGTAYQGLARLVVRDGGGREASAAAEVEVLEGGGGGACSTTSLQGPPDPDFALWLAAILVGLTMMRRRAARELARASGAARAAAR